MWENVHHRRVLPFVGAHLLAVVGEWILVLGIVLYAYEWGGAGAVGPTTAAILFPQLLGAPLAAQATARFAAGPVRLAGLLVQAVAYAGAALAARADVAAPVVVALAAIGLVALGTLRPTGAALLPALVRTARELIAGNLLVSYADSACALLGALSAAALGRAGGPTAILAGSAGTAAFASLLTATSTDRTAGRVVVQPAPGERGAIGQAVSDLRERPWNIGVLGMSFARNLVIGAFDVLLVVLAVRSLDLGESGPGLLTALVGAGALASSVVTTRAVRRARVHPVLLGAAAAAALCCVAIGAQASRVVVFVALPLLGLSLSSLDNLGRILLQRATDPRNVGSLFAGLGLAAGIAQLLGAGTAQVLLSIGDVGVAYVGVGLAVAAIGLVCARPVRRADAAADIPVVEMTQLGALPLFGPLPGAMLEAVARAARPVAVAPGARVISEGDPGDEYFAISSGEFDVTIGGEHVRTLRPGEAFGEIALLESSTRTATITARSAGELLVIERGPFLAAVTGHDVARAVAADQVRTLRASDEARLTRT